MTLIEVLGGLSLLAVVLTAVLSARAALLGQWAAADRHLVAADAADQLLSEWWLDPGKFPRSDRGHVAADTTLGWRIEIVNHEPVDGLEAQIVRLTIVDDAQPHRPVLVTVEVLLPAPVSTEEPS